MMPNVLVTTPPFWLATMIAFLLPILLALSMQLSRCKKSRKQGLNFPPGPSKLPIIGNLHQLIGKKPYCWFWEMSQKYGPVFQVRLDTSSSLIISSPEAAKEVLKDHDLECCSRPPSVGPRVLSYNFLDVAFSPYSDYWKEMRKLMITELLSMKRQQLFWYAREEQVEKLNHILLSNPYPNPINLTEKVFNAIDGFMGTIAFGRNSGQLEFQQDFLKVISEMMKILSSFHAEDIFPKAAGRFIDYVTGATARREEMFRKLDGYFQRVIDEHLLPDHERSNLDHEDIVDVLLGLLRKQRTSSDSTFAITMDHVKALLMDIFGGGIDTTAVTVTWAFSELIRQPKLMKKAQDEIRGIVGPNQERVEGRDVNKFKYLELVLKETLRKHPPAPLLIPHECRKQCKIGGYDVLPGTQVIINAYAIGKDPKIWDKPDVFNPERFCNNEVDYKGAHFQLIPFGSGRRICPGLAMATTSVKYILANLLYGFDYEPAGGMNFEEFPFEEEGDLVVGNKYDILVIPKKHEWAD